jgi:CTP synthase
VKRLTAPKKHHVTLGIAGKYADLRDAYASIDKAIEHCSAHLNCRIDTRWIDSTVIDDRTADVHLGELDGVIVPGGFGTRGVEGKIACVKHCREKHVPYLGICLGFQVAVIEFARNVVGLAGASSTEFDTAAYKTPFPVISELPEQKQVEGLGGTMRLGAQDVLITPGSLASFLSGNKPHVRERFRHRYEVDPQFIEKLESAGLVFSGRHPTRPIMQILELRQPSEAEKATTATGAAVQTHPFFIGAQFHPELTSRPLHPQPLFMGLIAAAIKRKARMTDPGLVRVGDPDVDRWLRNGSALRQTV